jgi:hypothetical protein
MGLRQHLRGQWRRGSSLGQADCQDDQQRTGASQYRQARLPLPSQLRDGSISHHVVEA